MDVKINHLYNKAFRSNRCTRAELKLFDALDQEVSRLKAFHLLEAAQKAYPSSKDPSKEASRPLGLLDPKMSTF